MSGGAGERPAFAAPLLLVAIAVAVVGFLAYLLLTAYADDLRPARGTGTHALSTSAVGYAGLAELIDRTHGAGKARFARREADLRDETLLVLTPAADTDPAAVKRILDLREDLPTLVILPKWSVVPLPRKPAWVQAQGEIPAQFAGQPLRDVAKLTVDRGSSGTRTVEGPGLVSAYEAGGESWAAYLNEDSLTVVVADADLFDNKGLKTLAGAKRALAILSQFAAPDAPIAFDLTLHGFGRNPNLLKLGLEPPFLPLTLCILLAALLAGWHALLRFGPAAAPERAIAFGKRALADNGAALLRLARRRHATGERYAHWVRDSAAAATGAPAGLSGAALDAYCDTLRPEGARYSDLAARAADARDTATLLAAARDLHHWKRTVTRGH